MDHLIKEKSKVGFGVWSRVAINLRSSSKAMTRSMESGRGDRLLDEDDVYQLVQKLYSLLQSGNDLRVVRHTLLDFNMGLVARGECGTRDAKCSPGLSAKVAAEGERQVELSVNFSNPPRVCCWPSRQRGEPSLFAARETPRFTFSP
jgi:hypothetical protein